MDAIFSQRLAKAEALRQAGHNPYANDFSVRDIAADLHRTHADHDAAYLEANPTSVAIGGRCIAIRTFGKAVFLVIEDRSGKIQANVFKHSIAPEDFMLLDFLDVGDIVGVEGTMMRTKRGELSILASHLRILTKSLRPLPEKWVGLVDVSVRYRQRYLDLIANEDVRKLFKTRSQILSYLRNFLTERDYVEVETPMLQVLYGGANARPFKTHHNALDLPLYLRIAPELNLKRLVVGGLHRVFDMNRCFRNEGVSTRHNPEFTMLEFYQAFATYEDQMNLMEEMLNGLCLKLFGKEEITYQGETISFKRPFRRLSVYQGLVEHAGVPEDKICDREALIEAAKRLNLPAKVADLPIGYLQTEVFEAAVEHLLIQPTFVTDQPLAVSPLARKKESNPELVDRFELYIAGRELSNAFSELNDPVDQYQRFAVQAAKGRAGDDEAHPMDEDYVRALEYGMPPTAGQGMGVDRLVMLMTDSASIRDVILFPLLKPEAATEQVSFSADVVNDPANKTEG